MQTGIGWRHPHYGELLQRQPAIGFLEVHSENFFADGGAALQVLEQGRALYPVSLHGVGLSLGSATGLDDWHLDRLARLVQRIQPSRVSDHACFARGAWHGPDGDRPLHAADLLPVPLSEAALAVMVDNVQRVQERLGRAIAVENLSAYIRWNDDSMDEPAFLASLARRTGCSLLVDVNNLHVNTLNLQLADAQTDVLQASRAWLDAIPPDSVAEIHLAGHAHCGDIVIDDHGSPVCDAVWDLYRHAVGRFGPVPTLIEWDTDIPALDVLLAQARHADGMAGEARATRSATGAGFARPGTEAIR